MALRIYDGGKWQYAGVIQPPGPEKTSYYGLLSNLSWLTEIGLWDTSSVTSMKSMFSNCSSLVTVPQFDTSSVTDMNYMFGNCTSLVTVPQFDTSSVTDIRSMFSGCSALTTVHFADMSAVTDANDATFSCGSLSALTLGGLSGVDCVVYQTALDGQALNDLFTSLGTTSGHAVVVPNAASGYNASIATAKGWQLVTY